MEEKGGREEEGPRPLGFRKRSWNGSGRDKCQKDHAQDIKEGEPSLHFTPHCLRHTYASLMLQQGEPVAYVQRQLGHASIQLIVDTYGKWLPMQSHAAVDRLDCAIFGKW